MKSRKQIVAQTKRTALAVKHKFVQSMDIRTFAEQKQQMAVIFHLERNKCT